MFIVQPVIIANLKCMDCIEKKNTRKTPNGIVDGFFK